MFRLGNVMVTYLGFLAGRGYVSNHAERLGGLRPTLGVMTLAEAKAFLNGGVVGVDRLQLREGAEPVSRGLLDGRLRYIERDPQEKWMSVKEIWLAGGGDCEDLASAIAAELQLSGQKAGVDIIRQSGRVAHAITSLGRGRSIDPSVIGGMRSNRTTKTQEVEALRGLL